MRPLLALSLVGLTLSSFGAAVTEVQLAIPRQVEPFTLDEVRFLDGPFKHAQDKDAEYLLSLDANRLLSWYRKEAGIYPSDNVYGGWEIKGVAGHTAGHYLSACSMMWEATGDRRFFERVTYLVGQLAECQRANRNGYLAAIPGGKNAFGRLGTRQIRSEEFFLNDVWVPWYTMHKTLAGLRDAYVFCENTNALQVAENLADWAIATTRNVTAADWQKMLVCEHGGMNEVLADLYALTGHGKYLELARKFYFQRYLDPLAAKHDELNGRHANTIIPTLVGCARLYELTGDTHYGDAARFFWDTVTRHHTFVTGSNSDDERFGKPDRLSDRLSDKTAESCNVYNMLKLTKALFQLDPQARYADYYERALWNHILASQNPTDGMVCYYLPLRSGAQKKFMTATNDFACCTGTGMENHARYGEAIYFHTADTVYVNQFIASEVNWRAKGLRIRQETDFPNSGRIKLTFTCKDKVAVGIKIRQGYWASTRLPLKLNGTTLAPASTANNYVTIRREWSDGDTLEVELPLVVHSEFMPDNPKRFVLLYGPIVLAADLGPATTNSTVPVFHVGTGSSLLDKSPTVTLVERPSERRLFPVLVPGNTPVNSWLKPVTNQSLVFRTADVGRPMKYELRPLYQIHDRRYSVYFDLMDERGWKSHESEYRGEQERLERNRKKL